MNFLKVLVLTFNEKEKIDYNKYIFLKILDELILLGMKEDKKKIIFKTTNNLIIIFDIL